MMTTAESTTPRYNCEQRKRWQFQMERKCLSIHLAIPDRPHIIISRLILHCSLDSISQETKDGTSPQKHGETAKHLKENKHLCSQGWSGEQPEEILSRHYLFAELDPLWCGGRRCESVGSIAGQDLSCFCTGQSLMPGQKCFYRADADRPYDLGTIRSKPGGVVNTAGCWATQHYWEWNSFTLPGRRKKQTEDKRSRWMWWEEMMLMWAWEIRAEGLQQLIIYSWALLMHAFTESSGTPVKRHWLTILLDLFCMTTGTFA